MAVDHTHSEAEAALDASGISASQRAAALTEAFTPESQKAELHRQARRQNFLDYGIDPGPDWDMESGPVTAQDVVLAAEAVEATEQYVADGGLQSRLNAALSLAVEEETIPQRGIVRGGLTVIRWGLMINDDSDDYTLGISVGYNDQEPADVYLDVTQQRVKEWQSLQGKGGEKRFAMGIVSHLVNLTGEDIAVAIASALGELLDAAADDGVHHLDAPTETALGPDDDSDVDEDGS